MDTSYLESRGWLSRNERNLLKEMASNVPGDGVIINIGVEYGASLHCIRAGNKKAMVIGIDIIGDDRLEGEPDAEIARIASHEFLEMWEDDPVDLVFVDGDHSYDGVVKDCEWANVLKVGGVIAFHDCYEPNPKREPHKVAVKVNPAVSEWARGASNFYEEDPVDSIRIFTRLE